MNKINIFPIPALKDNYIWAMIADNQQTIIVDPGECDPVRHFLNHHGLTLAGIFITHHHWDHTNGLSELQKTFNVPVWGPLKEKVKGVTFPVEENALITCDDFPLSFRVLNIPGHTQGHIAYYSKDILFCGDTLFSAGCGRLFEGTPNDLFTSLMKMANLPDTTFIYCAHEYTLKNLEFAKLVEPDNADILTRIHEVTKIREKNGCSLPSTLLIEKKTNPFLRCDSKQVISQVEKFAGQVLIQPLEVFTWLRKWKDVF